MAYRQRGMQFAEMTGDLERAADVGGDDLRGARGPDEARLAPAQAVGHLGLAQRIRAGRAAAHVGFDQRHHRQAGNEAEDAPRRIADALGVDEVAALIIDLRNNPGGLLESARKIASKFVPAGKLIVSTEGRDPAQKIPYMSDRGKKRLDYPLVLLVNAGSASGSEIVAGALQDLRRAVLVGETTFGKGSVQSIIQLHDGSALRLTTAKYYTPSHKVIHEHGVTPDIVVPISEEDERKLQDQRYRANLPQDDTAEKVTPIADVQLDRAIDVIKGVKLFAKQMKVVKQNVNAATATAAK